MRRRLQPEQYRRLRDYALDYPEVGAVLAAIDGAAPGGGQAPVSPPLPPLRPMVPSGPLTRKTVDSTRTTGR